MKILAICQYYYPEPFRITDICESLVERGDEVTVLTGLPNYPEGIVPNEYRFGKKRNETINGVRVIRCFEIGRGHNPIKLFLNYFSFAVSSSLKVLFMNDEYDVIFLNQLSPVMMGIPANIYKKRYHKKILLYCLDLWPDSLAAGGVKEGSIVYTVFLWISRLVYKEADTILVTSGMFKDYFRDILKLPIDNMKHLPQYAEEIFALSESEEKKDDSIVENKTWNFVFAGNIGDMQSVETIIQAAKELQAREDITFHIVGDGSKLEECKSLAEGLELKNTVFYGRRTINEMPKFYGMADAMLITLKDNRTLSYTLPGKIQSYMAAGKPIIGAINGETQRVIEESGCGLCCSAEDYIGLAEKVMQFVNSDKNEQMAINAKRFYNEKYSKERFIAKLEEALNDLGA